MRFVLLPLVDAHLPAPVSPPRAPEPHPRPRPYNPGSTRPCQTQPDSAWPSLAPRAPPSPLAPGTPGVSPTVLRYLKIWARIQAVIPQNAAHTTEPAVSHPHSPIFAPAEQIPPTLTRARRRLKSSVLQYLDFRPGLGPDLRDIAAQYSSDNPTPESQERDVVHEPVRCPAAPRDVCCDIACFGPRFTSWREISQHTSLDRRLHGAYG